jgi:hypothetical protein
VDAIFEDQLTVFIDFLGFSEASVRLDEALQLRLLTLLLAISAMRGEFSNDSDPPGENMSAIRLRPTITTFSDHIVASYPMSRINFGLDEQTTVGMVLGDVILRVARIAAAALRYGFLIRGGISRGKLYHSSGVVFGPAMIEAYELESRTAIYPRIVLSPSLARSLGQNVHREHDGIASIDYVSFMLGSSAAPGDGHATHVKVWFDEIVPIIKSTITSLENDGKIKALSKWVWFSKQFSDALRRTNPQILKAFNVSIDAML